MKETNLNDDKPYTDERGKFKEGNPGGGRPEGTVSIVSALKRKLEEVYPGDDNKKEKKKYADIIVDTILNKGIDDKDVGMLKDITDRVDGKPAQSLDVKATGDININIVKYTDGDKDTV